MIANLSIVFKLDGRELTLRFRSLPFVAWEELKNLLNFTPQSLVNGLMESDVTAIAAMVWLERKQRERRLDYRTVRGDFTKEMPEIEIVDIKEGDESLMGEDDEDAGEERKPDEGPTGETN